MAKILFRLRNVPDDEADDVRQLLEEHKFDFYETSPGNWGISMPAIWLRNQEDFPRAKELLDIYQQERCDRVRQEYQQLKEAGQITTMLDRLLEKPLQFIGYTIVIAVILYISISVFFSF